ncbi:MAG TPA: LPS assembly lipoprotein LptE [Gemmatimonadales bacterium]|nr:LPS assembly lipoprotein LptE [Gemmatimonadales bacterium]
MPDDIRTVAVLPFDNLTSDPTLTQDVNLAVRDAMERNLGLRQAGQDQADAIVRGSISRYEPDVPVAYTGTAQNTVNVTKRLVQITVSVEIVDQKRNRTLWQRSGLTVEGDYDPGQEQNGRRKALDQLVTNIVQGAQSQW